MLGLLFETSTEKALIALSKEGFLLVTKPLSGGPGLSKSLAIETSLLLGSLQPDFVAVGTGPGSYTGIRTGVAFAKALSFGWKIPLVSFCSLKAFVPDDSTPVLVDARLNGFYVLKHFEASPLLLTPHAAEKELYEASLLASPHPNVIQKRLTLPVKWVETVPDPQRLALLAQKQMLNSLPFRLSYLAPLLTPSP